MLEVLAACVLVLEILLTLYVAIECADELNPVYMLIKAWNNLREKLNLTGCIICIIPLGIISLPGVILSSVIIGSYYIVHGFWKGFVYVFRKRK